MSEKKMVVRELIGHRAGPRCNKTGPSLAVTQSRGADTTRPCPYLDKELTKSVVVVGGGVRGGPREAGVLLQQGS